LNLPARNQPEQLPLNDSRNELVKNAVGDHKDCAIKFQLAEKPISLEVAAQKYDPVYRDLEKTSYQGTIPLGAEFVEAHSCVFGGRRFAHVVLRYHGSLVSLLVTNLSNTTTGVNASTNSLSRPDAIVCAQVDGYKVSCFHTARHAIFVVSDLPEGQNLELARALAPRVFQHIETREQLKT
jgi:hypothetical protein